MILWRILGLFIIFNCLLSSPVYAQNSPREAESQIRGLLRNAYGYYDNLEMELMDEALENILDIAIRFPPQTQSTAQNIAEACILKGLIVFVNQANNHSEIKRYFLKALQYSPSITLSSSISTPDLERLFNEARMSAPPPQQPPPQNNGYPPQPNPYQQPPPQPNPYQQPPPQPNPYQQPPPQPNPYQQPPPPQPNPYQQAPGYPPVNPRPVNPRVGADLMHIPMANATAGRPFPIRVQISQNLRAQAYYVRLFYQTQGTIGTQRLDLQPTSPLEFAGSIPSEFMRGTQLYYYIVVYDQAENPIHFHKNSESPQVVNIIGGGAFDPNASQPAQPIEDAYVSVNMLLGSGAGILSGGVYLQKQKRREVINGVAWAPFHVQLELDFWLGQSVALGLFSRLQIVEFALLGGAHLKWFITNTTESKFALRLGGGYGEARHLVSVNYQSGGMTKQGLDTALQGPVFYKVGMEYSTPISDILSFVITGDFIHLITPSPPVENSPAKHFDVNLGLSATF